MSGWPVWTGAGYERAPQVNGLDPLALRPSSALSAPSVSAALDLVARQAPGYSLERAVHLDPDVYHLEMERIWRPAWLFAAHSAELPHPGARTVFDVGDDSVLIVRDEDGEIKAFHNLCRHRGNRLAERGTRQCGGAPLIQCPYHQWGYGLDGSLVAGRWTDYSEGLDPSEQGLLRVASSEVGGLIFVRLGAQLDSGLEPKPDSDREPLAEAADVSELAEPLTPQGFEHAKVAHMETYMVEAGWKVIWENNRECWHCHVGHPEYIRSHFDSANTASPDVRAWLAERARVMVGELDGLPAGEVRDGEGPAAFPSPGRSSSSHRAPLTEGHFSEPVDCAPVAPLMGDYRSYDVGVPRIRALPNFWCHASADHAVTTRLAPVRLERTEIVMTWLVDADAVEGRDYSLDRMRPLWARTSEQHWALCERNQWGILSPAYRPGPLAERQAANVAAFHAWYREAMTGEPTP
jgi:phenylpropionate dioxygenase-like ring-hydroxylating dioxygenase large terminal subunit